MQTTIHTTVSSSPAVVIGADDDAAYRTVSILSIVSLVLGLAAPLALFAPLLMVIPISGAIVALLAIRRIVWSEGTLIGRTMAVIGLTLCVASLTAAFTRTALTQQLLSRQARATALEWFTLLQAGDVESAYHLMATSRQAPMPKDPDSPVGSVPAISPLEAFRADPVVHFLLDHAKGASVKYVQDSTFVLASTGDARIQQLYSLGVPPAAGSASTTAVEVVVQQSRGANAAASEWLISTAKSDDIEFPPDGYNQARGHLH